MHSIDRHRYTPYLLLTVGTFFWSTNFILGKYLASYVPPFSIVAGRFTVSAIVFAGLAIWYRWPRPRGRQWLYILAMGFTGIFLFNSLVYRGLTYTTAINGTLFNSLQPLTIAFMAALFLKEKTGFNLWLGLLFSVTGVFLVATRGNLNVLLSLNFNPGDLLIIFAAVIWGIYSILVRVVTKDYAVLPATAYTNWIGVVWLFPFVLDEVRKTPFQLNGHIVLTFLYLGIFTAVIALFCWNWSVNKIGAARAGVFINLIPFYAAVLSPIFLGEKLIVFHFIGGLLIIGGVMIGIRKGKQNQDKPQTSG